MSESYYGAIVAWAAMFTPGLLLQFAALPFWARIRRIENVRKFLTGASAAAAGLMASAMFILWWKFVTDLHRAAFTVALFGIHDIYKLPSHGVILLGAVSSAFHHFTHYPF